MKKAVIICSGPIEEHFVFDPAWREDTMILCADGGLSHAKRFGVVPDVILGDGDSLTAEEDEKQFTRLYPTQKDETDSQLCLDWAIEHGAEEIILLGGTGGRLDHEFSCYCLLLRALKQGVRVKLVNSRNEIYMVDRSFTVMPGEKKYISFFPYGGDAEGVSIRGLKYEMEETTLACDEVRTCSNEFVEGKQGEISLKSGYLLVMLSDDKKE